MWRNWQTRWIQVPVRAISCGFKSHRPHQGSAVGRLLSFFSFLQKLSLIKRVFFPNAVIAFNSVTRYYLISTFVAKSWMKENITNYPLSEEFRAKPEYKEILALLG